ncbi:MAG: AzlC family ABC transporter permease [Tissierellia bacterium]|jgi:4-azaleucine resistance transporter AzlC|nr:AzlC family ABC transporter permease [Tissierellia bacterium]
MRKKEMKAGLISAMPMIIGFFPIAMAFGLLAKNTGVNFRDTTLFSAMVFAGASQFMALDLIADGVSVGSIILATFLLNLRHLVMSASLSLRLKDVKRSWLPLVGFGITDETFSVASFRKEKITIPYILVLFFTSYGSWVLGTIAGYLMGSILPQSLQSSLSIGLYAMFVGLLVPELKGSKNILYLAIIGAILYSIIYYTGILHSGWDIIFGIVITSLIGVFIFNDEMEGERR